MATQDATAASGQPGSSSQDPKATQGIGKGGITPKVQAVLDGLNPEQRSVIEGDINQRNQFLSAQRQTDSRLKQLGGILQGFLKDPQFEKYVEAREQGDVGQFFLDELKSSGRLPQNQEPVDNQTDVGDSPPLEEGVMSSDAQLDPKVKQTIEALESRVDHLAQALTEKEHAAVSAAFQDAHPDWKDWVTKMQTVNTNVLEKGLSLEDMHYLASREAQGSVAADPAGGELSQQATASEETAQPAPSHEPTEAQPDAKPPGHARSVHEALAQAKETLGIEGDLKVVFE